MKFTSVALLGLSTLATAHPALQKREPVPDPPPSDVQILQYALTLEHLEAAFYREGIAKLRKSDFAACGYDDRFYNNLKEVAFDEATHVNFLSGALGAAAVQACTYSFPFTDVHSFLSLAALLEGVGVSAYLGAAAYIANKAYLTAAGTILTVEARHAAYLRNSVKQSPFPAPFDTPLDFNNVYTLAAMFIKTCPQSNPPLPFMAHPTLTLAKTQYKYSPNGHVTFLTKGLTIPAGDIYAVFLIAGGPVFVKARYTHNNQYKVDIPAGATGQTYIVLNKSGTQYDDSTIIAGPAVIEVYKRGVE